MRHKARFLIAGTLAVAFTYGPGSLCAQNDPAAPPLSTKEQKRQQKLLNQEFQAPYKKWLNEDVIYIITNEERAVFRRLMSDDEREQFIEQFWLRRDPTPETLENEFEEEHYRRIAYANGHFATAIPGWKTDRGRIYITFGPPDEIESHTGGSYERAENGGQTFTYPVERWTYRYLEGIGNNAAIEFADTTMSGEYHLTMDPYEQAASNYTGIGVFGSVEQNEGFRKAPYVHFKDLEALVSSQILYNILPVKVETDYSRLTGASVLTNVTVRFENKDLRFQEKDGFNKAVIHIYGRVTTLSHRVRNTFEHTMEIPIGEQTKHVSIWQESIPLAPGMYRLDIVCKDVAAGTIQNYETTITVPRFEDDKLASSSLVLEDQGNAGPRIYVQLYNFEPDEKTHKANGAIDYEVSKVGSAEKVWEFSEAVAGPANQVSVEKLLPLSKLSSGQYELRMRVTDKNCNQTLERTAAFTVL